MHYEPFERVFVDRKQFLEWMENALERCKKESVILHVRGIGGIGKSSLVEHWSKTVENSIVLDFSILTELYQRLDVLARGAFRFGVVPRRFDVLWHIRQRFIKGVEPSGEKGRGWVLDVLAPVDVALMPLTGGVPVMSISKALTVAGKKLKHALTGKVDELGDWLNNRLGEEYTERLLEILWKEPAYAEVLYLDALVEDLNGRENLDEPILIMLDGFELVDTENPKWRHKGKMVCEAELWYVFLSSLKNCVGVVASRQSPPQAITSNKTAEEFELLELDRRSCIELLEKRGIAQKEFQSRIITVSGGNPFVISCICDIWDAGTLSLIDIENLAADTLEQVRVKTWRRLFSRSEGLLDIIDRAGLVPTISRRIMEIIAPSMKSAHWNQLIQLSFIKDNGDGTWTLHALARSLIIVELGHRLQDLTDEVSELLQKAAEKQSDYWLMGIKFSVRAVASEHKTIKEVQNFVKMLTSNGQHSDAYSLLSNIRFSSDEGRATLEELKGRVCYYLDRVAEAEQLFQSALTIYDGAPQNEINKEAFMSGSARVLSWLGSLRNAVDRPSEAEAAYWEAIARYRNLANLYSESYVKDAAEALCSLALLLLNRHRAEEAEHAVNEALEIYGKLALSEDDIEIPLAGTARTLIISGRLFSLQDRLAEAETAYERALDIYRGLAQTAPDDFSKRVGHTLHRLAYILLRRNEIDRTMDALQEELSIFNEYSKTSPLVYRKDLARALGSIGYMMHCTNRPEEAERRLQESLSLFRELKEEAPKAYSDSVANRINDLGRVLREANRHEEAEKSFLEALQIFQQLAKDAPEVYSFGECASCQVSITLQELGHQYAITNRSSEAEKAYQDAIAISADIARNIPHHRHTFLVSRVMHDYGIALKRANRLQESEVFLQKALQGYRELCSRAPEAYSHVLASGLNNYATLLRCTNRLSEAHDVLKEALNIYKDLAEKTPELFLRHYTSVLNNRGLLLRSLNSPDKALSSLEEALELCRRVVNETQKLYSPLVATVLNNIALLLKDADRLAEAEECVREAVEIRRELSARAPAIYLQHLATSLNNMGIILSESNRNDESKDAFQEAIKTCQILSDSQMIPPFIKELHTESLCNLYHHLSKSKKNKALMKDIKVSLLSLGISAAAPTEWHEDLEDEDLWFHEVFYHWSDCPFCV
jgi:tetratricopeptide (TPR) repeat protein